jgi:hypothetical protein
MSSVAGFVYFIKPNTYVYIFEDDTAAAPQSQYQYRGILYQDFNGTEGLSVAGFGIDFNGNPTFWVTNTSAFTDPNNGITTVLPNLSTWTRIGSPDYYLKNLGYNVSGITVLGTP